MADELRTERLLLRPWRAGDREPFATLNDDPAVMKHFPTHLTRSQSDAMVERISTFLDDHGWGLSAVEGVMRKLGMTRDEGAEFDHPLVPEDSRVRRHRLYRLARADWHRLATESRR